MVRVPPQSIPKNWTHESLLTRNPPCSLGPIVDKVPQPIIAPMVEKLSSLKLKNSVDNAVTSLALRSVIMALPRPEPGVPPSLAVSTAYDAIHRVLIPRLVGNDDPLGSESPPNAPLVLLGGQKEVNPESVDVLIEVVRCFGPLLQSYEVEALQQVIMELLEGDTAPSVVKKRAVLAISMLAIYLDDEYLDVVIKRLTSGLIEPSTNSVTRRLYISIMGSMARSVPGRFGPHIPETAPLVLEALCEQDLEKHLERIGDGEDLGPAFNEVKEAALVSLEAFLAACPQEMRPFTEVVISSSLRYLKYDPNYAMDEDDEDVAMDDDEGEDEEDDDFDADDGFEDDDDDASWKVRRCAAKTLYTLISTRGSGDLLDNGVLYSQAAPSLIRRIDEREENVRLEVISALALLVRKTGEGLHVANASLDDQEPSAAVAQTPLNRKRRRQSSAGTATTVSQLMAGNGLTSPVLEKVPPTGPRADLARVTPAIVKTAIKHLKSKTVPTKQSIINLLDDIVLVQSGGFVSFFADLIGPILETASPAGHGAAGSSLAGAGGSASATPSTLRVATLRLISDISKTHSSTVLQPYLTKIVTGVTAAVHDRFYKISSEAIRTAEELLKAITPPRARGAGSKYKSELESLFEVVMERCSANDADAEVRQRAIHAIGVLLSRTSEQETVLLDAAKRQRALDVIRERLKNETTRLAAARAVDNVAAFATGPEQLNKQWIQDVALELAAQLRKANSTLRSASVNALKHLILSKASEDQIDKSTVESVVTALMPAVTNTDTHLLGPALLILAKLAPAHPSIVVSQDTVFAICQLLKSQYASIVLDQLLELAARIGESGASQPLMNGLLKEVSISGEPSVVGKVIGILLVTGDGSAGFTINNFTSELENSSKIGDDARVSLALAVLGEAGMRLGPASPLQPDVFLAQFHSEPDKVSLAAAIALGRAGSGNVTSFLPVILEKMQIGGNTQYLLIQSLKEILQNVTIQSAELRKYAIPIWEQLLRASEAADNRVVCAECVGRLVTLDPGPFMPRLQVSLHDASISAEGLLMDARRHCSRTSRSQSAVWQCKRSATRFPKARRHSTHCSKLVSSACF